MQVVPNINLDNIVIQIHPSYVQGMPKIEDQQPTNETLRTTWKIQFSIEKKLTGISLQLMTLEW